MTTQENAANPFEYWREMFQKSTEAWAQAASGSPGNPLWPPFFGAAPGGAAPGFGQMPGFNTASGANPFGQFTPPFAVGDLQQMWQQFFNTWAEQARQAMAAGGSGPEALLNAQRQWTEQLEGMAKMFAEVMGTEAFANLLGRYMEQSLVAQQRAASAAEPQMDALLKSFNMPSRSQIDRMFERVIGLEDRIDDLEDENRRMRRQLDAANRQPAPRGRSRAAATPPAAASPEDAEGS